MTARLPRRGRVIEFDGHVGLGRIEAVEGDVFGFHCTQIADGSRTVPVGAEVEFEVVAGHLGRWEAAAIRASRQSAGWGL